MAFPVSNSKNERFFNQINILDQILCYRGSVAINVNDDVGHFFKQEKAFNREIRYPHYSLTL
jgi:hypothetical protein